MSTVNLSPSRRCPEVCATPDVRSACAAHGPAGRYGRATAPSRAEPETWLGHRPRPPGRCHRPRSGPPSAWAWARSAITAMRPALCAAWEIPRPNRLATQPLVGSGARRTSCAVASTATSSIRSSQMSNWDSPSCPDSVDRITPQSARSPAAGARQPAHTSPGSMAMTCRRRRPRAVVTICSTSTRPPVLPPAGGLGGSGSGFRVPSPRARKGGGVFGGVLAGICVGNPFQRWTPTSRNPAQPWTVRRANPGQIWTLRLNAARRWTITARIPGDLTTVYRHRSYRHGSRRPTGRRRARRDHGPGGAPDVPPVDQAAAAARVEHLDLARSPAAHGVRVGRSCPRSRPRGTSPQW